MIYAAIAFLAFGVVMLVVGVSAMLDGCDE
jgi:hypothetical protein